MAEKISDERLNELLESTNAFSGLIGSADATGIAAALTELAALRAAQANAEPVAWAVKPLEWGKTSYGTPEVFTVAGVYRINNAYDGGWSVTAKNIALRDTDGRANFPTVEAAKAAAQADVERRLAPYLHPAPLQVTEERVAAAIVAGWNACRKSIYAVCEDIIEKADLVPVATVLRGALTPNQEAHARGFHSGERDAAKRIARGFNSIEAMDDDNTRAALTAALGAKPEVTP